MMGSFFCQRLLLGGAVLVLSAGAVWAKDTDAGAQKESVVATLSKEQATEFAEYVHAKSLRREEFAVCGRLTVEKQGELKGFMDEMSKEFGMAPDKSYTFEKASRTLYLLSTNKVDKAGKPERSLVRQMKSESEAQYVSRLMVARGLTEQQLRVLAQLREEKAKEVGLVDAKLRKTFNLDPDLSYRLDEKTGQIFRLAALPTAEGAKDEQGKNSAAVGNGKKPAKK